MNWVAWLALTVICAALTRSLWVALGAPWRWPGQIARATRCAPRALRQAVGSTRRQGPGQPDPFAVLEVQHRLGLIATELRVLEAEDADRTYYARAHRIHTRRSAYDQLLAEACELAGVPAQPSGRRVCRNADERFSAEIELAARGWHW